MMLDLKSYLNLEICDPACKNVDNYIVPVVYG